MSQSIRLSDADGCKTIELDAIGENAELHITLQPDGDLTFAHIDQGRQTDFYLARGELTDAALRYVGLIRLAETGKDTH